MNSLIKPLSEYGEVQRLLECVTGGRLPVRVNGCTDSQKCNLMAALAEVRPYRLIITENEVKAREMVREYSLYDRNVFYYPAKDIIFYNSDVHGNTIVRERLKCLKKLINGEPVTVVTSFVAGMDKVMKPECIREKVIRIKDTDTLELGEFVHDLADIGYERTEEVSQPGEFAVRGGIIDVFPLSEENPYRIELWGDEVDSVRVFDVSSQRSIENVKSVDIFPAVEFVLDENEWAKGIAAIDKEAAAAAKKFRENFLTEQSARLKRTVAEFKENLEYCRSKVSLDGYIDYFTSGTESFFEYFNNSESIIFIDEPARIKESGAAAETEFTESMKGRLLAGYALAGQAKAAYNCRQLFALLASAPAVMLSTMEYKFGEIPVKLSTGMNVRSVNSYNGDFALLVKELTAWKKVGYKVVLLTASRSRAMRLAQDLCDNELNAFYSEDDNREVQPGEIKVAQGSVGRGFEYPLIKYALICETDIFGKEKKKHRKKIYEGTAIPDFSQLQNGDYVVHESYGVGIYRGIEKIELDYIVKDYIKIEYLEGGTLYVLASAMDAVQKYSGPEGRKPKLNKLGGTEWHNTKARVHGAVKEMAGELVKLYALRQAKHGYVYGKDTVWQKEFEEMFPYEETDDQLRAIEETKKDMQSTKIMDRLICGDVGYGKTEIAIRAAFKAVQEGKQVAFLVPTTILAQQHFNTFTQRMKDYPVRIALLSRFRTPTEQKKTIAGLKNGQVDIVIGTHRLLSKDMGFKNLGLLVVDEEQRFGVSHKEKIKQLKGDVDVLTLTATPIPRTLHMSLIGIRDMSILDEAPVDRLPIQTFVLEHNEEMIKEAICRELARGGQIYYVYNKVNTIADVAAKVQALVPDANVVYAHGQMNEHELESIMFSFVNGDIDILVSTTIIETGLDISNVNTILIDDADKFGLSQLYQLKGRVGRSNRTAYAYFMYNRNRVLSEVAEKRLSAIREFTELGAGFKIAMRDLEIRGAGNLLGAEQSGNMEAVGYDLYCKMLNEAVKTLKLGDEESDEFNTAIDMDIDAYIPSEYIRNEVQKLDAYKRIANIDSQDAFVDMQGELMDRYGEIPAPACNLLKIALLKAKAHSVYVTGVVQKKKNVKLELYERSKLDVARFPELLQAFGGRMKIIPGKTVRLEYTIPERPIDPKKPMSATDTLFARMNEIFDIMKEYMIG